MQQNHIVNKENLILVDQTLKLEDLRKIDLNDSQIITFDFISHKLLLANKISHQTSETYIDKNEYEPIQDQLYHFSNWHELKEIKHLIEFEGINIGELIYLEFFLFLVPITKKIIELKRILQLYNATKIFATLSIQQLIKIFEKESLLLGKESSIEKSFFFDSIKFENNLLKFEIPSKFYYRSKTYFDKLISTLVRTRKFQNNKTVLLVEFDTIKCEKLISNLHEKGLNIVFLGYRRPAIWNKRSLSIIKENNVDVITPLNILNEHKEEIRHSSQILKKNFKKLFSYDYLFQQFFKIDDISFWNFLKPFLNKLLDSRIDESIKNIIVTKSVFQKYAPKSILLFSESGPTEKASIGFANSANIPVLLFQHGIFHDTPPGHIWNTFTGSVLKKSNKFIVWGESMKLYCKEYGIPENQFEVLGNPNYDSLFNKNHKTSNDGHVLLITQGPAVNFHINDLLISTNDDYEKKLKLICKTVVKNKKKLIVKLHPYEITNNEDKLCKKIDPKIKVIKKGNIISLVNSCSVLISLGTSLSTAILEAHILQKPVLRIPFAEWMGKPDRFRNQFCFNTTDEEFDESFKKIYKDEPFHNKVIKIGHEFLDAYLTNRGNAAENVAFYVKQLVDKEIK